MLGPAQHQLQLALHDGAHGSARLHRRPRAGPPPRYPRHTEAFWNEIDKVLPNYRERQVWLRMHGAGLDL